MATAVRIHNGFISLRGVGADWGLESSIDATAPAAKRAEIKRLYNLRPGPSLDSIEFMPGAGNAGSADQLVVKSGGATGPVIAHFRRGRLGGDFDSKGDAKVHAFVKYFNGKSIRPFIDYSDSSFSATSQVLINFR